MNFCSLVFYTCVWSDTYWPVGSISTSSSSSSCRLRTAHCLWATQHCCIRRPSMHFSFHSCWALYLPNLGLYYMYASPTSGCFSASPLFSTSGRWPLCVTIQSRFPHYLFDSLPQSQQWAANACNELKTLTTWKMSRSVCSTVLYKSDSRGRRTWEPEGHISINSLIDDKSVIYQV